MLSCVIFNKSWVDALTPKFWWCILDIQGSSSVKFHDNWMCVDSPFVFYKWGVCCWNEQWTTFCYPWLCGFNSQVRVYVLSYNLIWLFFGMLGSYINFMNWFLYDYYIMLSDEYILYLWESLWGGIRTSLILRDRLWDKCEVYDKEL